MRWGLGGGLGVALGGTTIGGLAEGKHSQQFNLVLQLNTQIELLHAMALFKCYVSSVSYVT
ncbi:hypothetical protein Bhyg_10088 [Pseudolycoriella hygida]|uniref:Uncharacterized protein n=1 Tax=Pseudolycoriella hygida TaxID=35572 RepID=A0A9Q0MSV1_9DIPT|nr:hypothetical protein Bhyg_10088 [Pseudolycoriella hygida]